MNNEIAQQVEKILNLLIGGKFEEIEVLTNGIRLPSGQIQSAVEQYGKTLVAPPSGAYKLMDVLEVKPSSTPQWSVVMPLWTIEEGRSDLTIELTIKKNGDVFIIEFDDIHVM